MDHMENLKWYGVQQEGDILPHGDCPQDGDAGQDLAATTEVDVEARGRRHDQFDFVEFLLSCCLFSWYSCYAIW